MHTRGKCVLINEKAEATEVQDVWRFLRDLEIIDSRVGAIRQLPLRSSE